MRCTIHNVRKKYISAKYYNQACHVTFQLKIFSIKTMNIFFQRMIFNLNFLCKYMSGSERILSIYHCLYQEYYFIPTINLMFITKSSLPFLGSKNIGALNDYVEVSRKSTFGWVFCKISTIVHSRESKLGKIWST